jgi:hypothetical protein
LTNPIKETHSSRPILTQHILGCRLESSCMQMGAMAKHEHISSEVFAACGIL